MTAGQEKNNGGNKGFPIGWGTLALLAGSVITGIAFVMRKKKNVAGASNQRSLLQGGADFPTANVNVHVPVAVAINPGDNIRPAAAKLFLKRPNGDAVRHLGWVVSCPQSCAATRPGGSDRPRDIYPTPEWMREITFVDELVSPADYTKIKTLLGSTRINSDPNIRGCGHVSKSVRVTHLKKNSGTGEWSEQTYAPDHNVDGFNALAAYGKADPHDGEYLAREIWISDGRWNPTDGNRELRQVYFDILHNRGLPLHSPCPAAP